MKSMIRNINDHGVRYQALAFICPGCELDGLGTSLHMLPVNTELTKPAWTWDGNLELPTISPSILTKYKKLDEVEFICHSFLNAGLFDFLGDCTHSLVGQKVPIPDLPTWIVDS